MSNKFAELEGIHSRGDYDLTQHQKFSGQKMQYFDQERNEKYIPHIVETSVGLNRLVMMILDQAYTEEEINGETRVVLKIKPSIAPITAAIFPLTKDKKLVKIAKDLNKELLEDYFTEYDQSGSIGKRYRRQDEIGTPFCITVDFESLDDNMITIRDRDTLVQVRIPITDVKKHIQKNI